MTDTRRLSEYFSLSEWDQPEGHGCPATPVPASLEANVRHLHNSVLYPLRCGLMVPITITPRGGYRSEVFNRRCGGARRSQHKLALAADIKAKGYSAKALHDEILRRYRAGLLPGLRGLGLYDTFVHVDARDSYRLRRWDSRKSR